MTKNIISENPMSFDREAEKKKMKKTFNRLGWGITVTMLIWLALLYAITIGIMVGNELLPTNALAEFYNKNMLLINEGTLLIAIIFGFLIFQTIPEELYQKKISFGGFLKIMCICFTVSYIGNIIGTIFLTYWGAFTGNEVGNELEEILSMTDPWMMVFSVGILAPLLEELVFRKFLIDRMRKYGEVVAILVSAGLFALFHQNFAQFLYTFAAGIMLGYLYYRTGNYWLTVLLHAIFNLIGGVLPTLLLPDILAVSEEITALEAALVNMQAYEEIEQMLLPIISEYGTSILLYGLYSLFLAVVNIAGFILLIIGFRKYRAEKGSVALSAADTIKAIVINPGMLTALILLGILTISSLFMV